MDQGRPSFQWYDGFWLTGLSAVIGAVDILVGVASPRLYTIHMFAFLTIAAFASSLAALGAVLWRVRLRSRRWRDLRFWLAITCNLAILTALVFLYHRGQQMPAYQEAAPSMADSPATPG
jgi:cytochrome c oxidase assembly factor CtaG